VAQLSPFLRVPLSIVVEFGREAKMPLTCLIQLRLQPTNGLGLRLGRQAGATRHEIGLGILLAGGGLGRHIGRRQIDPVRVGRGGRVRPSTGAAALLWVDSGISAKPSMISHLHSRIGPYSR